MINGFFLAIGWIFKMLYLAFKFIWDAHYHLLKNLIFPRRIIFPTLKDDNNKSIKRD